MAASLQRSAGSWYVIDMTIKKLFTGMFLSILLPVSAAADISFERQIGAHTGEARFLEYRIEYLEPKGITTVDAAGITYAPFAFSPMQESTSLPPRYYGDYSLYFSQTVMRYRVYVKNTGPRMFLNLRVLARQEFLDVPGGWGEAFPEPTTESWFVAELSPQEEVVLEGSTAIPSGPSGLDQTHVQIVHEVQGDNHGGEIIVDDPQAGIWCPVDAGV